MDNSVKLKNDTSKIAFEICFPPTHIKLRIICNTLSHFSRFQATKIPFGAVLNSIALATVICLESGVATVTGRCKTEDSNSDAVRRQVNHNFLSLVSV